MLMCLTAVPGGIGIGSSSGWKVLKGESHFFFLKIPVFFDSDIM